MTQSLSWSRSLLSVRKWCWYAGTLWKRLQVWLQIRHLWYSPLRLEKWPQQPFQRCRLTKLSRRLWIWHYHFGYQYQLQESGDQNNFLYRRHRSLLCCTTSPCTSDVGGSTRQRVAELSSTLADCKNWSAASTEEAVKSMKLWSLAESLTGCKPAILDGWSFVPECDLSPTSHCHENAFAFTRHSKMSIYHFLSSGFTGKVMSVNSGIPNQGTWYLTWHPGSLMCNHLSSLSSQRRTSLSVNNENKSQNRIVEHSRVE